MDAKIAGIVLMIIIVVGLALNITSKVMTIGHWFSEDFKLEGWHPYSALISWISVISYFAVIIMTPVKEHWYFWVIGIGWIVFNLFLTYGLANTYGFGLGFI